jgi:hypothetical protein
MTASGPLHPLRDDGSELDATFEIGVVPVFDLVFHHKARGRNDPRALNQDYHEALETLLRRLAMLHATILGISVDSSVAKKLDEADRELALSFPIQLGTATDAHALRLEITRAQKPVARRPGTQPSGGNDQKRIRMTVALTDARVDIDGLASRLVRPPSSRP